MIAAEPIVIEDGLVGEAGLRDEWIDRMETSDK
jgi:hypothetical protein